MRILVADRFPEQKLSILREIAEVDYQPDLKAETLPEAISNYEILCVRSTRVTEETIKNAQSLVLIIRVGSGINTIDVQAASERGIYVANCPGKNSIAVAELTMGLILAADRRIPQATESLRRGKWLKKEFARADGLKGKKLGIVGWGRIGQAVGARAKAFELEILVYSRPYTREKAQEDGTIFCPDLETLCREADIISVHLPLTEETKGLFGAEQFKWMKRGAIFINTSRGEIVDQDALLEAMNEKDLKVGLDVFSNEPGTTVGEYSHPILNHPNFIGTPHIGASTKQAQNAVADEAIRIIKTFIEEGWVPNCVNLELNTSVQSQMIVRHYNRVGVLASVLDLLRSYKINVENMRNVIFKGELAAVASLQLDKEPPEQLLEELRNNREVIQISVFPIEH